MRLIVFLPQSGCPEKNSATGRHHFLSEDASCLATDSFFFVLRKGDSGSSVRKKLRELVLCKTLGCLFKLLRGRFRMAGFKIFNYDDIHVCLIVQRIVDRDKKCWFKIELVF